MINLLCYIVILAIVVTDAWSDAYLDKRKIRNHYLKVSNVICFFLLILLFRLYTISYTYCVLLYFLVRVYAFNYTYNLIRGLPGFYRGETDDIFDKWAAKLPTSIYATILFVSFFLSIVISFIFR